MRRLPVVDVLALGLMALGVVALLVWLHADVLHWAATAGGILGGQLIRIVSAPGRMKEASVANVLSSITNDLPALVGLLKQGAAFEAGQAVAFTVPTETVTIDLTDKGLGKFEITTAPVTVSIKHA